MSETVRLNSIKDVVARTRLSRSKVYTEMDSGRLRSVKVGRRRLVTESALIGYIANLTESGTPDWDGVLTSADGIANLAVAVPNGAPRPRQKLPGSHDVQRRRTKSGGLS
jgi:excisionase family DNA binding protein